jgi:hypothetical protein
MLAQGSLRRLSRTEKFPARLRSSGIRYSHQRFGNLLKISMMPIYVDRQSNRPAPSVRATG